MNRDTLKSLLQEPFEDRLLYAQSFMALANGPPNFISTLFDLRNELQISLLMEVSGLQDPFKYRVHSRSLRLAQTLIDENGQFKAEILDTLIKELEKHGHIPYPKGESDAAINEHFLHCLKKFQNKAFVSELKRFQKPLCHKAAERIVRDTIGLKSDEPLSDRHIRIAVLASLLCYLRQSVGSCFATAPAILIQREQPENLLADLHELLTMGKLKRIFSGREFSVPLSPSTGIGDLRKFLNVEVQASNVSLSPGLIFSLEQAGVISSSASFDKKSEEVQRLLSKHLSQSPITVAGFLSKVLLEHFSFTEEEILQIEKQEISYARQSRYGGVTSYSKSNSKRREQYFEFLDKERTARSAFTYFADNLLLKAWEFTLASFSEVKLEFSRWNLYSSLGLHHEEEEGIGQLIYRFAEEKIEVGNRKLEEYQRDYELAFDQLRAVETLLKRASSESEARRLKAEFQSRLYHMQACLEKRDEFYKKASRYTNFYSFLMKEYDVKLQEYFQEIYDAEMQDVAKSAYDDSPAGFRLVYKHGRQDASLWTMIYTSSQYIECLTDFFSSVEMQISSTSKEIEEDIKEVTSLIIAHLQTEQFLSSAYMRMAKVHRVHLKKNASLEELQASDKKPWAYTSGGTMSTLLKTYYRKEGEITEEPFFVKDAQDLLTFLIDTLKAIPFSLAQAFSKNRNKGMLMYSPSHAFILQPGFEFFEKGWEDPGFTYTWIRDVFLQPRRKFYTSITLSFQEQEFILERFLKELSQEEGYRLRQAVGLSSNEVSVKEFQEIVFKALTAKKRSLKDQFDSLLFRCLPLIPSSRWKACVYQILEKKSGEKLLSLLDLFPEDAGLYITAQDLQERAKACFLLLENSATLSFDLHRFVAERAQELGLASPKPLLFADTNWTHNYFAFVVNPGHLEIELWRMSRNGTEGSRMTPWDVWMNEQNRNKWGIYVRPHEYGILSEKKF